MYGLPAGKSEKSEIPKNSENSTKYAVEIVENSVTDNITEIIGNPEDVEVIDGNSSGNETKPRTARKYSGGHSHSHSYSGSHHHYGGYGIHHIGGYGIHHLHHHYYSSYSPSYYYSYYSPSYYGSYYGYGNYGYGNYGYNNYYGNNYNCNNYYYGSEWRNDNSILAAGDARWDNVERIMEEDGDSSGDPTKKLKF
ncbi:hypothetical protein CRE_02402 [Caenorhabditis remanei]|uniref:Uncharacterized protein n=1 Tax=Caenorhabditis remanei TaxID=31234 RepID=E3MIM3_CAERE|nr:hypothetical protein CRE_02402 [Caenorhabditis remanei]